mmetsp:Transcript_3020/g.2501  ORF Transcript_3020/g.2501 Transcript_3020/m.2501 type:complete len:306 (-) Transcript_3020:23-940(-)
MPNPVLYGNPSTTTSQILSKWNKTNFNKKTNKYPSKKLITNIISNNAYSNLSQSKFGESLEKNKLGLSTMSSFEGKNLRHSMDIRRQTISMNKINETLQGDINNTYKTVKNKSNSPTKYSIQPIKAKTNRGHFRANKSAYMEYEPNESDLIKIKNPLAQASHLRNISVIMEKSLGEFNKNTEDIANHSSDSDEDNGRNSKRLTVLELENRMKKETQIYKGTAKKNNFLKRKLKTKFPIFIETEGERWRKDKIWQAKANPVALKAELKWNETDLKMLEKRRKQRLLKNSVSTSSKKQTNKIKASGF